MFVKNDETGISDSGLYYHIQKTIGSKGIFTLGQARQLKRLEINGFPQYIDGIEVWENGVYSYAGIGILKNLKYLSTGLHPVRDITPLGELVSLETLILDNFYSGIEAIAKLENLKHLEIYGGRARDLEALVGLKKLEILVIVCCAVEDFSHLAKLKRLKSVDIFDSGYKGVPALIDIDAEVINIDDDFTHLDIWNCRMKSSDQSTKVAMP